MDDSHLVWKNRKSKIVYSSSIFKLKQIHCQSPEGNIAPFIQIAAPDWVTIIPELSGTGDEKEFLLVRQYRHGNASVGMEFPAGTVDLGEKPMTTAARELLEETGYKAMELVEISAVSPNPAFMNNTTYTFLARGLEKVADQTLDTHEFIDIHSETYTHLLRSMGKGSYISAITVQAWYFYLRYIGKL